MYSVVYVSGCTLSYLLLMYTVLSIYQFVHGGICLLCIQSCLLISLYIEVSAYYVYSLLYLSVGTLRHLLLMYTVLSMYQFVHGGLSLLCIPSCLFISLYIELSAYYVYSLVYLSVRTLRYLLIMYTVLSTGLFVH